MLLFVGCLVPTMVLAAFEEPFRMDVLTETNEGTPLHHNSNFSLLYSYFIFSFLAAITFGFVVIAVRWLT
jgi:hypothetical protein